MTTDSTPDNSNTESSQPAQATDKAFPDPRLEVSPQIVDNANDCLPNDPRSVVNPQTIEKNAGALDIRSTVEPQEIFESDAENGGSGSDS